MDQKSLFKYANDLDACQTTSDIENVCVDFAADYRCEFFTLRLYLPIAETTVSLEKTPSGWRENYEDHDFFKADPTVTYCRSNISPIIWRDIDHSGDLDPDAARHVMQEAANCGMQHGISCPMHGAGTEWGMLSLASSSQLEADRGILHTGVALVASLIHVATKRVTTDNISQLKPSGELTNREIECLEWIAKGKTAWEVARILQLSEYTVTFHTRNAIAKLGTINRSHAVAKALSKALINFV